MSAVRIMLGVLGVGSLVWGLWLLSTTQRIEQTVSAVIWLVGAVAVHDFLWVPLLELARRKKRVRQLAAEND